MSPIYSPIHCKLQFSSLIHVLHLAIIMLFQRAPLLHGSKQILALNDYDQNGLSLKRAEIRRSAQI